MPAIKSNNSCKVGYMPAFIFDFPSFKPDCICPTFNIEEKKLTYQIGKEN